MAVKKEFDIRGIDDGLMIYTCIEDNHLAPGITSGPQITDLYIIECCTDGSGTVSINDKVHAFTAGDCFILKPKQKLYFTSDAVTSRKGIWCAMDGNAIKHLTDELKITADDPFLPVESFPHVRNALTKILEARESPDMGSDYRSVGELYSLLGILLNSRAKRDKNVWIEKAILYMECNYSERINVSDICAKIGLERTYFSTLFKSVVGITPHAYLSEIRIRKAISLMKDGVYSPNETAELVGLDSQTFKLLFKRATGKTPNEFKKSTHAWRDK